jgi:hypothetical protein
MNEAASEPVNGKSGIGETITTALRQPSFLRVVLVLAALVVVFTGMRLTAPILDPDALDPEEPAMGPSERPSVSP